jgi:hypothetical protein
MADAQPDRFVVILPARGRPEIAEVPEVRSQVWTEWLRARLGGAPRSLPVRHLAPAGFVPVLIVNGALPHRTAESPPGLGPSRLAVDLNSTATALHCTHSQCFMGTGAIIGTAVLACRGEGGGAPLRRADAEALWERLR